MHSGDKRKRLLAGGLGVAVVGLVILASTSASTPTYQGEDVEYWFAALTATSSNQQVLAAEAFDAMGSRSVPFLLSQVEADVPTLANRAQTWVDRKVLGRVQFVGCGLGQVSEAATRQDRLNAAFGILGSRASEATRELERALHNPICRYEAATSLVAIGPAAWQVIERSAASSAPEIRQAIILVVGSSESQRTNACRLLLRALRDSDGLTRHYAAFGLGELGAYSDESVPALTAALDDADSRVRYISLFALAKFGTNAAPSLLSIRKLESDPDESVRKAAKEIFAKLDAATDSLCHD